MKDRKIIIFSTLAGIIFIIITIAYCVSQTSAVYPPMKEYKFLFTKDELGDRIINIDRDDNNLSFKITDTTGTSIDDVKYYANLHLTSGTTLYEFHLFYKELDKTSSIIGITGAFDNTHKLGGYIKNSETIKNLIDIFENKFINKIDKSQ
ncbi:hypothetical protein ACFOW1_11210 [Parasediminibacterium paludis]|uniref:DUF4825 domain-containing protein n=1 Tax=Parasediminibacterium paludis TaxID=908966 RepID=A0ABV8PWG5_9BACT